MQELMHAIACWCTRGSLLNAMRAALLVPIIINLLASTINQRPLPQAFFLHRVYMLPKEPSGPTTMSKGISKKNAATMETDDVVQRNSPNSWKKRKQHAKRKRP